MTNHLLTRAAAALALCGGAAAGAAQPPAPAGLAAMEGEWVGQLDAGGVKLRLILHVRRGPDGIAATLDSPDQNAAGLPATVTVEDGRVHISAAGAGGAFEGEIAPGGASLKGDWSGAPTVFTRQPAGEAAAGPRRPQTPLKPYPYREEPVAYPGGAAGVRMAGTLTLPQGSGPFPAVVLIAGSGPHGRDERIFGHAPFLVLADHLTRRGIAVLRFDKRGIGESTGDYGAATTTDFAADVEAGLAFLRGRPEIDRSRLGLIGHSEGGIIAPMVADRDPDVAFLVLMAGPGVRGDRVIMAQSRALAEASGLPAAAVEAGQALERRFLDAVLAAKDEASAETAVRAVLQTAMPEAAAAAQARAAASPWYRSYVAYDPAPALSRLRIPVLALIGSKDRQVLPEQNLPALRAALAADPHAEVAELPGLNHLFQEAGTGAASEYGEIEQTLSPAALDRIAGWIVAQPPR